MEGKLILQVHDELIVECPQSEGEQVARILEEEMERVVSLSVPLLAEAHVGRAGQTPIKEKVSNMSEFKRVTGTIPAQEPMHYKLVPMSNENVADVAAVEQGMLFQTLDGADAAR